MTYAEPQQAPGDARNLLIGVGLLAGSALVLFFTASFIVQAFKGPRPITDEELLAMKKPGAWNNYVTYKPSKPAIDTNLQWGKKGNPGTKYLLLPVGDQLLLCSARIANDGPTYVGRLDDYGDVEKEIVERVDAQNRGLKKHLTPFMLQAVRSIWVDTVFALALILGMAGGGVWKIIQPRPA